MVLWGVIAAGIAGDCWGYFEWRRGRVNVTDNSRVNRDYGC